MTEEIHVWSWGSDDGTHDCSTGIVDCGPELVLGAVWVMKLMLEMTEDVAGATEAVAESELMRGVGGEIVIPQSNNT